MSKRILIKPHITEKTVEATKKDMFTFIVSAFSRKEEIKKAVEKLFGVNVLAVNIIKSTPEVKKNRFRQNYLTNLEKKATVTLKKRQKISLFESESE